MKFCTLCLRCYDDSVASCTEESHPPLSETQVSSRNAIAGYRLEYLLESSLRGYVFRARQVVTDQTCLIKILETDDGGREEFLREARLAASVFHPSLMDVYEAGSLGSDRVYVVCEDVSGQTLRELLNNVGVPQLLTSVQVVRQTAEALHTIHQSGLIHRSVSPQNIILATDAEHRLLVRIQNIDFGGVVGHFVISNKFLIDSAMDSIKYFSPEQCSNEPITVQSDVYSLGIVLYEMLAGVPPFEAEKATALIEKHRNQLPPEITINSFDLRMLLTHTLTESLQKQPDKRQSSANAFARQLRHIEQLATHTSTPPPAGAPVQTKPTVVAFAASAAGAASPPNVSSAPTLSESTITKAAEPDGQLAIEVPVQSETILELPQEQPVSAAVSATVDVHMIEEQPADELPLENVPSAENEEIPDDITPIEIQPIRLVASVDTALPQITETHEAPETPQKVASEMFQQLPAEGPSETVEDQPGFRRLSRLRLRMKRTRAKHLPATGELTEISEPHLPTGDEATTPSLVERKAIETPKTRKPKKVRIEELENDIPSEADVLKVLLAIENDKLPVDALPAGDYLSKSSDLGAPDLAAAELPVVEPDGSMAPADPLAARIDFESRSAFKVDSQSSITRLELESEYISGINLKSGYDDLSFMAKLEEAALKTPLPAENVLTMPAAPKPDPEDKLSENKPLRVVDPPSIIAPKGRAAAAPARATKPRPETTAIVRTQTKPILIEWDLPDDDIPSEAEAREVLLHDHTIISPELPPTSQFVLHDSVPTVDFSTFERIVPRRNNASPKSADIQYFPTILGHAGRKPLRREMRRPNNNGRSFAGMPIDRRILKIVAGFVMLLTIFLVGDILVRRYVQADGPNDSAAKTSPAQRIQFPAGQTNSASPSRKKSAKRFDDPLADDINVDSVPFVPDSPIGQSKPSLVRTPAPFIREKPQAPMPKSTTSRSRVPSPTMVSDNEKTQAFPSTLVIYSDNGRVQSRLEPERKSVGTNIGKKSASVQTRTSYPSRPRIVDEGQR